MTQQVEWQDWIAITQLKARYCRFLDTKQWDNWAECFTTDYELDVSEESGLPPIRGRSAAIASVRGFIEHAVTCHQVHTPEMTVEGDTATVIWPMQDRVIFGASGPSITGFGHYHERLARQNGQWRISHLKLTRLHIDMAPSIAPQTGD